MAPTVDELRSALAALSLDARGHKDVLAKRLRKARAASASAAEPSGAGAVPSPPATRPEGEQYDSFLVFDVEATCERMEGVTGRLSFAYPNEIIEWPVVLLQWRRDEENHEGWRLEKVNEFQSFVRPTWRPKLSAFCTELTGITQKQVDAAPTYSELLDIFHAEFIHRHQLFTKTNRTVWVTDGPWDLRDFISKASFISGTPRPPWLAGKMLDLRLLTATYFASLTKSGSSSRSPSPTLLSSSPPPDDPPPPPTPKAPPSLNITDVLLALQLLPFEGRLHSGISDARNIARILVELQRRGVILLGNRTVPEGASPSSSAAGKASAGKEKRWGWMGKSGQVEWEQFWRKESVRLSGLQNGAKRRSS